tara:strand:+ start:7677 stop:7904 length:228 start_codon:yes stop_codon:yes gene_type:complete
MNPFTTIYLTKERWLEIQERAESVGIGVEEFINVLFDIGQQIREDGLEDDYEAMHRKITEWQQSIIKGEEDEQNK